MLVYSMNRHAHCIQNDLYQLAPCSRYTKQIIVLIVIFDNRSQNKSASVSENPSLNL